MSAKRAAGIHGLPPVNNRAPGQAPVPRHRAGRQTVGLHGVHAAGGNPGQAGADDQLHPDRQQHGSRLHEDLGRTLKQARVVVA